MILLGIAITSFADEDIECSMNGSWKLSASVLNVWYIVFFTNVTVNRITHLLICLTVSIGNNPEELNWPLGYRQLLLYTFSYLSSSCVMSQLTIYVLYTNSNSKLITTFKNTTLRIELKLVGPRNIQLRRPAPKRVASGAPKVRS